MGYEYLYLGQVRACRCSLIRFSLNWFDTRKQGLRQLQARLWIKQKSMLHHYLPWALPVCALSDGRADQWWVGFGQVIAGCFTSKTSSHCGQERGKSYTVFYHQGIKICQKTFLFLHAIRYGRFKAIKEWQPESIKGGARSWDWALKRSRMWCISLWTMLVCMCVVRWGEWVSEWVSEWMCMCVQEREGERD